MKRRVIAIVIALVVALIGAFGMVAYAQDADSRAVAGQGTQEVFIAQGQVPKGTTAAQAVAQKLILRQRVVARGVPVGALKDVSAATGALVATSDIMAGEIVLTARFGKLPDITRTAIIPAGKIAITVTLTDPQRIAPFLTPKSHIVLFVTSGVAIRKGAVTGPTNRLTRILLPDVEVIGVGDLTGEPVAPATAAGGQGARQTGGGPLVTVALTPADGQLLVHEIQAGNLLYGGLLGASTKVDPQHVVVDASVLGQ